MSEQFRGHLGATSRRYSQSLRVEGTSLTEGSGKDSLGSAELCSGNSDCTGDGISSVSVSEMGKGPELPPLESKCEAELSQRRATNAAHQRARPAGRGLGRHLKTCPPKTPPSGHIPRGKRACRTAIQGDSWPELWALLLLGRRSSSLLQSSLKE